MPFTELAFPKLKMGLEVKEAFAEKWSLSAKVLASQSTISRAFFGSVISENGFPITQEENKPIIVIEWTKEDALKSFLTSEDFAAFAGPMKPLSAAPAELQLFNTDVGPLKVASASLMEIIRVELTGKSESQVVAEQSWTSLARALGTTVPVTSGTSLNLKEKVFMGTIGWNSLEARASTLEAPAARTAFSKFRELDGLSSIIVKVEPIKAS